MTTQTRLRIAPHANGQTAIFDSVGLVCTMEAGSQPKRDTDAAYIVGLEREVADRDATIARLREALERVGIMAASRSNIPTDAYVSISNVISDALTQSNGG